MTALRKRPPPPDYKSVHPARRPRTGNGMWVIVGMLISVLGALGYHVWGARYATVMGLIPQNASITNPPPLPEPLATEPIKDLVKEPIKEVSAVKESSSKKEAPREKVVKPRLVPEGTSTTSFDFYKLLPNMKVGEPEHLANTPAKPTATPQKPATTKDAAPKESPAKVASPTMVYMLQAGAFRTPQEAERLRAMLAFMGLESTIQTVKTSPDIWHKVRLGPFRDVNQATQIQQRLRQQGIATILSREHS